MENEELINEVLNKYTNGGKIKYSEIGEFEYFKERYQWYKEYLSKELPDLSLVEIIKFHKHYHKFKEKVYAFNGFNIALYILEKELENENIKN